MAGLYWVVRWALVLSLQSTKGAETGRSSKQQPHAVAVATDGGDGMVVHICWELFGPCRAPPVDRRSGLLLRHVLFCMAGCSGV